MDPILVFILGSPVWMCLVFWYLRAHGPSSGWRRGAQCLRCGHLSHGYDTPVWGFDKTCPKCGPSATWRRVTARPIGFFAYEVRDD